MNEEDSLLLFFWGTLLVVSAVVVATAYGVYRLCRWLWPLGERWTYSLDLWQLMFGGVACGVGGVIALWLLVVILDWIQ